MQHAWDDEYTCSLWQKYDVDKKRVPCGCAIQPPPFRFFDINIIFGCQPPSTLFQLSQTDRGTKMPSFRNNIFVVVVAAVAGVVEEGL